jgi:hypothetical protein
VIGKGIGSADISGGGTLEFDAKVVQDIDFGTAAERSVCSTPRRLVYRSWLWQHRRFRDGRHGQHGGEAARLGGKGPLGAIADAVRAAVLRTANSRRISCQI